MIKAYIDVPAAEVVVHRNPNCSGAKVGPGENVRHVLLNPDSISKELARFMENRHRFSPEPGARGMWLVLDFQDTDFEVALARHLQRILGLHHGAFTGRAPHVHC